MLKDIGLIECALISNKFGIYLFTYNWKVVSIQIDTTVQLHLRGKSITHRVSCILFTAIGQGLANFLPEQFNEFDLEQYFVDVSIIIIPNKFQQINTLHLFSNRNSTWLTAMGSSS